ncbi:MAG TPA: OmpA family protein [Clostridiales bacterium]|nr:OmpA family protein [Clostridiales bacterium]
MSKRRGGSDYGVGYYWMDTYGDMVTLLLTFFVLLYSISSVDTNKWKILAQSIVGEIQHDEPSNIIGVGGSDENGGFESIDETPPDEVTDFSQLYAYLKKYVEDRGLQDSISLHRDDSNILITFSNHIFFDGNSAVIRQEGKEILDFLTDAMKNIGHQIGKIKTYGHTARVENNNFDPYFDDELSCLRAAHVCTYMRIKLDGIVPPQKQSAEGMGEWWPAVPHDGTEETRKINRRVEICIAKEGGGYIDIDRIYNELRNSKSE